MVTYPNASDAAPPQLSAGEVPMVSVVLPVRDEAGHIERCLERLLVQDYPTERLEILVVDGRSEDGTRERVRALQARHPDARLRLLDNPRRTVPPGLNAGIRAARGEVIVRMDGHTVPAGDYVSACVSALKRSGAANVGGVIEPVGDTTFGHAVARATAHPLGAGDARYRINGAPGYVDTVPFGAFRREVFERVGLFDESLVRNQDYELNVRVRSAGERIYFDPAIRSTYVTRGSLRALWSQYVQYGWWKMETVRRHPRSLRWRQAVPPAFVVGVVVAGLAAPWSPVAAIALAITLGFYLGTLGIVASRVGDPPATATNVMLAFLVVHFAFSLGFLLNVASGGTIPSRAAPPDVPSLTKPRGEGVAEVVS